MQHHSRHILASLLALAFAQNATAADKSNIENITFFMEPKRHQSLMSYAKMHNSLVYQPISITWF